MVSRRNFAAITMIMMIVLFLFQGLNLAKEKLNHYEENTYAEEKEELQDNSHVFGGKSASGEANTEGSQGTIAYIGKNLTSGTGGVVAEWCRYMKYEAVVYSSVSQYEKVMEKKGAENPEFLIVDPENLDFTTLKDTVNLQNYVKQGVNLIFSSLPDVSVIQKSQNLRELLGIAGVREEAVTVKGLDLYDNLMLGGENIYQAATKKEKKMQDLELTFPWFQLSDGTKVYMKGLPEDETLEDKTLEVQEYPVVIWRKSFGTASVFAINGDYLEDETGLGILTGMLYETRNYLIYPVVNAQNLVIQNYPSLAEENSDQMQEIYGNSTAGVVRDIIWPSIASIHEKGHLGLTCMLAPKLDYDNPAKPDGDQLNYYAKLIHEEKGEMGLSVFSKSETGIAEKLKQDQNFMQKNLDTFSFSSFYSASGEATEIQEALQQKVLEKARTAVVGADAAGDLVSYQDEQTTRQKIVTDGADTFTYRSWMKMKSIESALGYTSVALDLDSILYPETEKDRWEKVSKEFAANVGTYWKPFSGFEGTTVSECDARIRTFLNSRYEDAREKNTITLQTTGADGTAYYVLRTHNESVKKVTGGTAEKLEDSAWLIRAEQSRVTITLEAADHRYYREKGAKNE